MSFTFELSDFASRIRVAYSNKDLSVNVTLTRFTLKISEFFYNQGFITSFFVLNSKSLILRLKYHHSTPLLRRITLMSTPGRRLYWNLQTLAKYHNRQAANNIYVLSTPKGLCTSTECLVGRQKLVAGEVLFHLQLSA